MKVAGIDVHKKVLMVVVVDASTPVNPPVMGCETGSLVGHREPPLEDT